MAEKSFIDSFHDIIADRSREIQARQAEQDRLALSAEMTRLDDMHEDDLEQRKAIADRRVTLNMAWYASTLLLDNNVRSEEWFRDVDTFEERGVFKKRLVKTGTRPELALDGWQFYDFSSRIKPIQSSFLCKPARNNPCS